MQRDRSYPIQRRQMLCSAAGAVLGGPLAPSLLQAATHSEIATGYVVGEPTAEKVGTQILTDGGNVVDAIVGAALAVAIAAPHQTGLGGYGAHGVFAVDAGKRIVALDANGAAPAAMRADAFRPDEAGKVPGRINEFGWLAAGVPGILAGLQLALDRFGTRSFRDLAQPAIGLARNGIHWPASLTEAIQAGSAQFEQDPGSRKLYFRDGRPLAAGTLFQNHDLAEMLETLAQANSVEAFYRGEFAQQIAGAFQKNGGLLTAKDLANYQARLVEPLALKCNENTIYTAPLTAGGLTVIQALTTMQAMKWEQMPDGFARTHARMEAVRLAWRDRLSLLGDPEFTASLQAKLLSLDYARECALRIEAVVQAGKFLAHAVEPRDHQGTIHLSAADKLGNFAALTLTHGNSFGARVTVEGLGLTLGHGMSRFDPRPDHPNAPGPGKRPLHNMVPTVVTRGGQPVLAVGARGGRKIPNAILEVLTRFALLGEPLARALAAPRPHTEGDTTLEFEKAWSANESAAFAKLGYTVKTAGSATVSAVALENGILRPGLR